MLRFQYAQMFSQLQPDRVIPEACERSNRLQSAGSIVNRMVEPPAGQLTSGQAGDWSVSQSIGKSGGWSAEWMVSGPVGVVGRSIVGSNILSNGSAWIVGNVFSAQRQRLICFCFVSNVVCVGKTNLGDRSINARER